MTYNEIVKALECCVRNEYAQECQKCPLETRPQCEEVLFKEILDLINRQKEEKEALIAGQETLQKYIADQKAEIERLKEQIHIKEIRDVYGKKINNPVKEMVGDGNV